jgi:hypothetical protein
MSAKMAPHATTVRRTPKREFIVSVGANDPNGDLEALNVRVQDGLIEAVSVDPDGTPYYRIASRFLNGAKGPGRKPETLADQSAFGGSSV